MLDIALKEWAVVCDLLVEGRLAVLLRKGGILEAGGPGMFELEHPRFALFPSWAHQRPLMIKESVRDRVQVLQEPEQITVLGIGEAARIWAVSDRGWFDALDDLHCWTPAQVDMRFNYKPQNPLYLIAVRVRRLAEPRTVVNDPAYAGCRSWVPLLKEDRVDDAGAIPVLDDETFAKVVSRIESALGSP